MCEWENENGDRKSQPFNLENEKEDGRMGGKNSII